MAEKNQIKTLSISNIEININEINIVDNFITQILIDNSFGKINYVQTTEETRGKEYNLKLKNNNENIEFISLNENRSNMNLMNEEEFFELVGKVSNGISKKSGRYQESLYSNYLKAKKEADEGYLSDVLNKAVVFRNNLNYVRKLMKNEKFMKAWKENFGEESPEFVFKNCGKLRRINIIQDLIK